MAVDIKSLYEQALQKKHEEELLISTQQGKISSITDRVKTFMADVQTTYADLENPELKALYKPLMEMYDESRLQDIEYAKQLFTTMQQTIAGMEKRAQDLVSGLL